MSSKDMVASCDEQGLDKGSPVSSLNMDYCFQVLARVFGVPKEWVVMGDGENAPEEIRMFLKETRLVLEKVKEEMG